MKKYSFSSILFLSSVLFVSMFSACDEEEFVADDIRESLLVPEITEFSPKSGGAGTEVTVNGNNLATISAAYIGDVKTKILYRVSNSELVLKVVGNEKTGTIELIGDSINKVTSSESFTMEHVTPSISSISPTATGFSALETVKIKGSNLKSVLGFYFGDEEAKIEFLNDSEADIQIPYAAGEKAKIRLKYYAPGVEKYVESSNAYNVLKKNAVLTESLVKVVSTTITMTFTGEELDIISQIFFGDTELTIVSHTATELVGAMSKGTLTGEVTRDLKIIDKHLRSKNLKDNFKITLP